MSYFRYIYNCLKIRGLTVFPQRKERPIRNITDTSGKTTTSNVLNCHETKFSGKIWPFFRFWGWKKWLAQVPVLRDSRAWCKVDLVPALALRPSCTCGGGFCASLPPQHGWHSLLAPTDTLMCDFCRLSQATAARPWKKTSANQQLELSYRPVQASGDESLTINI